MVVRNSSMSNAGTGCVSLAGYNGTVMSSRVWGCGGSGISIEGGDRPTLAPGNLSAVGNIITNFSRVVRTYQPGIAFSGVGLHVANNTIAHGPHTGITGSGNNNLFEYNTISHVSFECTDTGAFYVGRSWAQRGNVARFNTFDTIRSTERLAQKSCSQNAFYLDDEMSGWDFYGNTILNSTTGVLLGGGRHNRIHDNHFVGNDKDIAFDNRGMSWQSTSCKYNCTETSTSCFRYILDSLHYKEPPYSIAYPDLPFIYDAASHPCVPVGNVVEDNTYCHTNSQGGGLFIDKDEATISSWFSRMSNNRAACP